MSAEAVEFGGATGCSKFRLRKVIRMEQNYVMNAPTAIVLTFVVLAACQLAQAVIEPLVFALFVITITWPLEKAFQTRLPKAVALLLTMIMTLLPSSRFFG